MIVEMEDMVCGWVYELGIVERKELPVGLPVYWLFGTGWNFAGKTSGCLYLGTAQAESHR